MNVRLSTRHLYRVKCEGFGQSEFQKGVNRLSLKNPASLGESEFVVYGQRD
jgi:hypothetical protein